MRKLKLYTAVSMDGLIAGPNGEIDWLDEPSGEDYGYTEFYESIDTTVMGMETYRLVLTADEFPYSEKTNYVVTRSKRADEPHVSFVSDDIVGFTRALKERPGRDIWLIGGGQINTIMLNAGLIDEVILTSFPIALGAGIPLFGPDATRRSFRTVGCQTYPSGLIQWKLAGS